MPKALTYLLWSNEHEGWHVEGMHGYTANVEEAGRFSEGKALDAIVAASHAGLREKAYVMVAAPEHFS